VAIASAIIGMAHTLGLKVVAEGIEEPAQLEFLRQHKCDEAQGYLLSRPLNVADARRFLVEFHDAGVRRQVLRA
jgi:EAL domain-containing protein (putative c-di-GMP-specific phosphodiesterase class I)